MNIKEHGTGDYSPNNSTYFFETWLVVFGAILLAVILSALLWGLQGMAKYYFGLSFFEFALEMIMAFICFLTFILIIVFVGRKCLNILINAQHISRSFGITLIRILISILLIWLLFGQFYMSYQLANLKNEFSAVEIMVTPKPMGSTNPDDPNSRELDYGGKLDKIVSERDKILSDTNYYIIGTWSTKWGKSSIYIWTVF